MATGKIRLLCMQRRVLHHVNTVHLKDWGIYFGCTTYSSSFPRLIWYICPRPTSASNPRPVTNVFPQCAKLAWKLTLGFTIKDSPVHARREFRCAITQSCLPSRFMVEKEVDEEFVPIMAVSGDVEVTF